MRFEDFFKALTPELHAHWLARMGFDACMVCGVEIAVGQEWGLTPQGILGPVHRACYAPALARLIAEADDPEERAELCGMYDQFAIEYPNDAARAPLCERCCSRVALPDKVVCGSCLRRHADPTPAVTVLNHERPSD